MSKVLGRSTVLRPRLCASRSLGASGVGGTTETPRPFGVRQLYERYQSAESDEERHEMEKLDGRRHAEIYAALENE